MWGSVPAMEGTLCSNPHSEGFVQNLPLQISADMVSTPHPLGHATFPSPSALREPFPAPQSLWLQEGAQGCEMSGLGRQMQSSVFSGVEI